MQGLNCWCWVLVCIGFGRRYLNRNSPLSQLANEVVYPFYMLHQTVLITLAHYILQWPATTAAKFLLIALGTLGGTLLLYSIIWRFSMLRVLFGLKPRRLPAAVRLLATNPARRGLQGVCSRSATAPATSFSVARWAGIGSRPTFAG